MCYHHTKKACRRRRRRRLLLEEREGKKSLNNTSLLFFVLLYNFTRLEREKKNMCDNRDSIASLTNTMENDLKRREEEEEKKASTKRDKVAYRYVRMHYL